MKMDTLKMNKKTNILHFEQLINAILNGKYSWACVLFLHSAGYNPLDYIPYRTYNRLSKENSQNEASLQSNFGGSKKSTTWDK